MSRAWWRVGYGILALALALYSMLVAMILSDPLNRYVTVWIILAVINAVNALGISGVMFQATRDFGSEPIP